MTGEVMETKILIQSTPNPNALKFILNRPVKTEGKATYKTADETTDMPLAKALFEIDNVSEVYFFENFITITQNGEGDWDDIEEKIKSAIEQNIDGHNPDFQMESKAEEIQQAPSSPELDRIEAILNQTVRPALQADGGDLRVVNLEGNVLTVNYQGACGSCPSAAMGTLKAIENILREEFDPNTVVEMMP